MDIQSTELSENLFKNNVDVDNQIPINVISSKIKKNIPTSDIMTLETSYPICRGLLCIFIFINLFLFIGFMVEKMFLVGIILISSTVICILVMCIFNLISRIEIIKDFSNNKVIVNKKNIFSRVVRTISINKDNIHFFFSIITKYISNSDEDPSSDYYFFVINNFKDLNDIDLKTSGIKLKPAVLFYSFKNFFSNMNINNIYQFLGSKISENPFLFDVQNYMKNKSENVCSNSNSPSLNRSLNRLMKFNSHFFTYFYVLPDEKVQKTDIISRIDFIYSKNYDELFIGLVNLKNTSYVNTFDIDLTKVDEINAIDEPRIFAIIFSLKSGEKINISGFTRINQINKLGLLFLLKENFKPNILNKENVNNSQEVTPY